MASELNGGEWWIADPKTSKYKLYKLESCVKSDSTPHVVVINSKMFSWPQQNGYGGPSNVDSYGPRDNYTNGGEVHHYYGPDGKELPGPIHNGFNIRAIHQPQVPSVHRNTGQMQQTSGLGNSYTLSGMMEFGHVIGLDREMSTPGVSSLPTAIIMELEKVYGHLPNAEFTITNSNGDFSIQAMAIKESPQLSPPPPPRHPQQPYMPQYRQHYANQFYHQKQSPRARRIREEAPRDDRDLQEDYENQNPQRSYRSQGQPLYRSGHQGQGRGGSGYGSGNPRAVPPPEPPDDYLMQKYLDNYVQK